MLPPPQSLISICQFISTTPLTMATPQSIPQDLKSPPVGSRVSSVAGKSGFIVGSQHVGTPPLPQIPTRGSVSGSLHHRRASNDPSPSRSDASPSPDTQIGGKKKVEKPAAQSALTASLKPTSKDPSRSGTPEPSGSATPVRPDESAFSTLADVPDEEKARVLRRHLVSAEERSSATTPAGGSGDDDSAVERPNDEAFPIPYDAPGGDVTCVAL